ncbi:MAG: DUF5615 family PIN-like protein [Planctomycetes bacterium]|nr:DUF5615 family PIN-like protein [Planctomycetota bacterium]
MLKFVTDEDMPRSTSKCLEKEGYEAKDIRDYGLSGANDDRIFQFAQRCKSVLITGDTGFGNILEFPLGTHYGIVIAHFPNEMSTAEVNHHLVERIKELTANIVKGNLIIVEPGKVRIRKK